MANGVSTEWFDLQVKYGNYLPNEKKTTLAEEQKLMQEKHEEDNKLENKLDKMSVEKINELEDDLDFDDEFTRQYMANRMQQLKIRSVKEKYGQVIEISRDEYIKEVTEADPESFVLLHLYQNYNEFCNLINMHLPVIAKAYGHVKFVKIIATKCIDKFPDERCPCFIIYKAGKPVSNLTNVDKLLNNDVANIAGLLHSHGIDPL